MDHTKLCYRPAAKGHNRYCGPGALSILLGIDTQQAAWEIRSRRRNRAPVRGAGVIEMLRVLDAYGMKHTRMEYGTFWNCDDQNRMLRPMTLNQWLDQDLDNGIYLVVYACHYGIVSVRGNRRYYNDNRVKEWVNARTSKSRYVQRRGRIAAVYRIG